MSLIIETRAFPIELEERNDLISKMEQLVEVAKSQGRGLNGSEQRMFAEYKEKIERIDIKQAEESVKHIAKGNFESRGMSAQEEKEVRSFVKFIQTGEHRDLSSTGSGVVIPKSIADQVISKIKELSPLFANMQHYNVQGNLSVPIYDWSAHTTQFTTDFAQLTATGGTFLTADLKSFPIVSLAKIGRSLANQSNLNVVDIIIQQIAMSFVDFINKEIITNTNAKFSGTLQGVTNSVTGATVGALGLDDLISLQLAVASVFQPNCAFLMHPSVFAIVRKLKDTTGQPLMIAGNESLRSSMGYKLLGADVWLDENMPNAIATGNRAIYYGSFKDGLVCNTNAPMSTQVLMERFSDQYAIGILTSTEIDVNLSNNRALAVLVGK